MPGIQDRAYRARAEWPQVVCRVMEAGGGQIPQSQTSVPRAQNSVPQALREEFARCSLGCTKIQNAFM